MVALLSLLLATAALFGCGGSGPAGPGPGPGATTRILFIGNSLTATNDLPSIVEGISEARGDARPVVAEAVVRGGYSLDDHWNAGGALEAIDRGGWDFVVLQQGPSSLPESRVQLIAATERFAVRIRAAGAVPALLAVWPESARENVFPAVHANYAAAAAAVDGIVIPAGESWRAAWRRSPALGLWGGDGFHPSLLGSTVAAAAVHAALVGPGPVPQEIPRGTAAPIRMSASLAGIVQSSVAEAVAASGR